MTAPAFGAGTPTPNGSASTSTSNDANSGGDDSPPIDLSLTKKLVTAGPVHPGQTVEFSLVPHDNGPGDAKAGWSVSDLMPAGMTFRSATGAGYDCSAPRSAAADLTCVADGGLEADADGAAIRVIATLDAVATGSLRNEAWVSPAPGDVPETSPLKIPAPGTDTTRTDTNNDAHADVTVTPVVTHPSVTFDKRVEKTVDVNRNGYLDANDEIFYRFRVTNTGDVALTGVVVNDRLLTRHGVTVTCAPDTLAPGQSVLCEPSAPYRITRAEVGLGVVLGAPAVHLGSRRGQASGSATGYSSTPVGSHMDAPRLVTRRVLPNAGMPSMLRLGGICGVLLVLVGWGLIRSASGPRTRRTRW